MSSQRGFVSASVPPLSLCCPVVSLGGFVVVLCVLARRLRSFDRLWAQRAERGTVREAHGERKGALLGCTWMPQILPSPPRPGRLKNKPVRFLILLSYDPERYRNCHKRTHVIIYKYVRKRSVVVRSLCIHARAKDSSSAASRLEGIRTNQ